MVQYQPKIAGFALVDDFNGDVFSDLGMCLYNKEIIPVVIGLKKGRNVVDRQRTIMTETDLTFNRARTQIDALVIADDYSCEKLIDHNPFRKIIQKMVEENQLVIAMGIAPVMLAELGIAAGRNVTGNAEARKKLLKAGANVVDDDVVADENLITAKSLSSYKSVCNMLVGSLKKAA